jgi:hypothetical protein
MKMEEIDLAALDRDLQKLAKTPQQHGWFRRNWKWFVPLDLLIAVVVVAAVLYWALFIRVYNLEVCQAAMEAIEIDPAVREALGEPIQLVKWPSQEAMPNARIEDSEIDVIWHIEGPKGRAKAHVNSRKRQGAWDRVVLEVTLPGGKKMPIQTPDDTENVAKPWVPGVNPGTPKPETKSPETKDSDLNIDLPVPPADAPPEAKQPRM